VPAIDQPAFRAERQIGFDSDLVVNYQTWLGYPADRVLSQLGDRSLSSLFRRVRFGASAPWRYDVLHYYFGRSSLCWDDLPGFDRIAFADLLLAKRLGKKVLMTLQGCDARLAAESNRANEFTPCGEGLCPSFSTCVETLDDNRRHLIEKILPLCDHVFALNPELMHFVPNAEFLPYANVDLQDIQPTPSPANERPVIVHAPSAGDLKGTPRILAAIEKLADRYDFEFVLVENKTHKEAMEIYRRADLAIDQVLFGWYGGFAVEMMALGKPVACYIRESDCSFVPDELMRDLPIVRLNPHTLADDLGHWLERSATWRDLGLRSRKFVEKWHDPVTIAKQLSNYYTGNI